MELRIFQVDAFTDHVFGGNPACVVLLDQWLDDPTLLNIARENCVAETAFVLQQESTFHIRWFTPEIEMDLCGHATLAAAHVLKEHQKVGIDTLLFDSNSGTLTVHCEQDNRYTLDFPSRMPSKAEIPDAIKNGINIQPKEIYEARDLMLVYENEESIRRLKLDRHQIDQINLDPGGIIFTAPGQKVDFVSRYFTPQSSIFEDPVTGSAHCSLVPYWSKRLNKKSLTALQLSARGGVLHCVDADDRVMITGNARTYMVGTISVE